MRRRLFRWVRRPRRHLDRPAGPANPFEAWLLVTCVVQGVAIVFGYARPPALEDLLPEWLRYLWGVLLLVGGAAAVIGLYWPWDPLDGILVKRVGLIGVAGGTLAYGVALLALGGAGFVGAVFDISFAAACLVRAWQVTVALAAFRAELGAIRRVAVDGKAEP